MRWILLSSSFLLGCAQFRGGGEFRTGSDYSPPARSPASRPTVAKKEFQVEWPVMAVSLSRGFKSPHEGLDLRGKKGTPIYAAHEGVVVYAGNGFHGYGNFIIVEYSSEWATLYAHLSGFNVNEGQRVTAGDQIGRMGRTGHASGVHLHFELIHRHQKIDPIPLLSPVGQISRKPIKFRSKRS